MILERRYDIDWLRVITIGLLLIYHIAIIFQPWAMLIGFIKSESPMEILWKPMTMLNVWRIPILFYVSGMGLFFAIRKRSWIQLLLERTRRILLPFIFGIVVITPLHMYIFQAYYNLPLTYFPHTGHLWFLGNIFVYVLLLSPVFFYLKKNEKSRFMKVIRTIMSHPFGPLLAIVFFVMEVLIVQPQIFAMYADTWHGFSLGLLAFFFGFLFAFSGKVFWQTVLKWRWLYLGSAAVLYLIRIFVYDLNSPAYLMSIESNVWILGILGFGYKYLNKPSTILSYLSQAAYPVYIIHMFVLYAAAAIILPLELPIFFKFLAIVSLSALVCYLIYEYIIKRIGILRPLFGLKWKFGPVSNVEIQPESTGSKS